MTRQAALRLTLVGLVAPVLLLLGFAFQNGLFATGVVTSYRLAATASAAMVVSLIAPVAAGAGAVAGSRWRRGSWCQLGGSRSPLQVVLNAAWPLILAAVAAIVFTIAFVLRREGLGLVPSLLPTVSVIGLAVAAVLLGFGVGTRLPLVIAGPAVVLGLYLLFVVPTVMEPSWLRQVVAQWDFCCQIDEVLDPRGPAAALLLASALAALGLWLMSAGPGRWLRPSLAVVVLALVGAALVVDRGSASGVVPRTDALVCRNGPTALCLYPEHQDAEAVIGDWTSTVVEAGRRLGLTVPHSFSEQLSADGLGYITAVPDAPPNLIRLVIAGSLLPDSPCHGMETEEDVEVPAAARVAVALEAGMTPEQVAPFTDERVLRAGQALLAAKGTSGPSLTSIQDHLLAEHSACMAGPST